MTSALPIIQRLLVTILVTIAIIVSLFAAACDADPSSPTPARTKPGQVVAPDTPAPSEISTARPRRPVAPTLPATNVATPPNPTPMVVPPVPRPTPNPGNTEWVRQRLDAVIALYQPTPAGVALLHSLDVRQMRGEPGFFGSYGFESWAGVGEAKPIPLMHELGHSYWGAFPIIGRPDLEWQRREGVDMASAMSAYHQDILAFMAQPPDEFEILRQRLRNLPDLSSTNTEPLFHNLEADLPHTTGGDLALVPPILSKYWGHFLTEGPFGTWEQAAGWLRSLAKEDRVVAGKFLGFEHLDLRHYQDIPAFSPSSDLLATASETLAEEERRRLTDLAEQFDLLVGDPQLEVDFQFWRGYLQDKVALYQAHPEHLSTLSLPRASEISSSLAFLGTLEGSPGTQAAALQERISSRPFLVNFLPAVDDRTLVELFAGGPELPTTSTLQATAGFVERLQRYGALVDGVHAAGRRSPGEGTAALQEYLDVADLEQEHDLKLFFDLFHSTDPSSARLIMAGLDASMLQALMVPVPVQLRVILDPETLFEKLGITADAPEEKLTRGLMLLLDETSGNYRIDEPFLEQLFRVIAARAAGDTGGAAKVISNARFPLEGFILNQPAAVSLIMSGDIDTALDLVEASDPVLSPPPRIIYRMILADPSLAAMLVDGLDQRGETELVVDSLAYFAYDKIRSDRFPGLPISLEQDGAFLQDLLDLKGEVWLADRLGTAVETFRSKARSGEISPHFLAQFRQTLDAAAATTPGNSRILLEVVERAFGVP